MYSQRVFLKYLLLATVAFLTFFSVSNSAQANTDAQVIKGVIYEGEIREIDSEEDFVTELHIKELSSNDGKLSFIADATYEDSLISIESTGEVYNTLTDFVTKSTKANTVVFENQPKEYEIISFTIEENADKNLLLPINGSLADKTTFWFSSDA